MTQEIENQKPATDEAVTPNAGSSEATTKTTKPSPATRPRGKLEVVLKAIERRKGATLAELTEATGWQPHTTRAALTRLRHRGFPMVLVATAGRKAYRLQGRR